jgi:hypothetical protein
MPTFSYTVMQDLYALGELHEEAGIDFAEVEAGTFADYADNVSKQLNDCTPRTLEEYKTEFVKRMKLRLDAAIEYNDQPELEEFHKAVGEYLDTLLPKA